MVKYSILTNRLLRAVDFITKAQAEEFCQRNDCEFQSDEMEALKRNIIDDLHEVIDEWVRQITEGIDTVSEWKNWEFNSHRAADSEKQLQERFGNAIAYIIDVRFMGLFEELDYDYYDPQVVADRDSTIKKLHVFIDEYVHESTEYTGMASKWPRWAP